MNKMFLTLQSSHSSSEADPLANNSTDLRSLAETGTGCLWNKKEESFECFGEFMLVNICCENSSLLSAFSTFICYFGINNSNDNNSDIYYCLLSMYHVLGTISSTK